MEIGSLQMSLANVRSHGGRGLQPNVTDVLIFYEEKKGRLDHGWTQRRETTTTVKAGLHTATSQATTGSCETRPEQRLPSCLPSTQSPAVTFLSDSQPPEPRDWKFPLHKPPPIVVVYYCRPRKCIQSTDAAPKNP